LGLELFLKLTIDISFVIMIADDDGCVCPSHTCLSYLQGRYLFSPYITMIPSFFIVNRGHIAIGRSIIVNFAGKQIKKDE